MKPLELNLRHLRAMILMVECGSMSAAADAAHLSQPALTQGLAKLEKQLRRQLFERRSGGLRPTAAGLLVATRAAAAFEHLGQAAREAFKKGVRGHPRAEQMMTATQLRAFLALADAGSFSGASVTIGVSEPAVHRAVRDLERTAGAPLAERRGRGVQLTARGLRLARGVRLAESELGAALIELDEDGDSQGCIAVGTMPLARARVLPAAIAAFQEGEPTADVRVIEGSWRELVDSLRDGVLDVVIGALRSEDPAGLEQRPLFRDQLTIVGRASHPLCETSPTIDDLSRFGWIVGPPGSPLRSHWEELFQGRDLPPMPIACGSTMVTSGLLADTDLLTLLSPEQIRLEVAAGILTTIGPPLVQGVRTIGLTTRVGWRPTAAQARLLRLIESAPASTPPKS